MDKLLNMVAGLLLSRYENVVNDSVTLLPRCVGGSLLAHLLNSLIPVVTQLRSLRAAASGGVTGRGGLVTSSPARAVGLRATLCVLLLVGATGCGATIKTRYYEAEKLTDPAQQKTVQEAVKDKRRIISTVPHEFGMGNEVIVVKGRIAGIEEAPTSHPICEALASYYSKPLGPEPYMILYPPRLDDDDRTHKFWRHKGYINFTMHRCKARLVKLEVCQTVKGHFKTKFPVFVLDVEGAAEVWAEGLIDADEFESQTLYQALLEDIKYPWTTFSTIGLKEWRIDGQSYYVAFDKDAKTVAKPENRYEYEPGKWGWRDATGKPRGFSVKIENLPAKCQEILK